jgi:hypothetical protein
VTTAGASDPRPRPQYGEYATPEEQRARIAQPDAALLYEPAPVLETATGADAAPVRPSADPVASPEQPRSRAIDRIVTFALLAYGLVNVVSSFPALIDYSAYADTMFRLLGVDATLSDPAAGRPWGIASAIVLAVGWFVTAVVSWVRVRRGRISWWIPLVGGVVFTFASAMLVLVPIMNDPAVWDALVGSIR